MKNYPLQSDQMGCGPACINAILRYYGRKTSIELINNLSGLTQKGTTFSGLKKASEKFGLVANGYSNCKIADFDGLKLPILLQVERDHVLHFIVVFKKSKDKFLCFDPAIGNCKLSGNEIDNMWKSKKLLHFNVSSSFKKKNEINGYFKKIFRFLLNDSRLLVVGVSLGLLFAVLGLSISVFSQKLIDEILPTKNVEVILNSFIVFLLILLFRSGLNFFRNKSILYLFKDFSVNLNNYTFEKIFDLPNYFLRSKKDGDFIARINDINKIQGLISNAITVFVADLLLILSITVYFFVINATVGIVALMVIISNVLLSYYFANNLRAKQFHARRAYSYLESRYVNFFSGLSTIKYFKKENAFVKEIDRTQKAYQSKVLNFGILRIRFSLFSNILNVIFISVILYISTNLVVNDVISIGYFTSIVTITLLLTSSAASISQLNALLQEAQVVTERLLSLTELNIDSKEDRKAKLIENIDSIVVKKLMFGYTGVANVLQDVNFTVSRGQFVSIYGASGQGKSTFLKILAGDFSDFKGEIAINDHLNWNEIDADSIMEKVKYIPQSTKVFHGTVLQNISMSFSTKDHDLCYNYLINNNLIHYFNEFPNGVETFIGEDSFSLSGGQLQLVGVIRALYFDPQVLLLDEFSSSMDEVMKANITDILSRIKTDKIIINVTHDKNFSNISDQEFYLKNGKLNNITKEMPV